MSMAMLCRLLRAHVMPAHREIMSLIPQKQVNIIHARDSFTITPALVIGSQLEQSQHAYHGQTHNATSLPVIESLKYMSDSRAKKDCIKIVKRVLASLQEVTRACRAQYIGCIRAVRYRHRHPCSGVMRQTQKTIVGCDAL